MDCTKIEYIKIEHNQPIGNELLSLKLYKDYPDVTEKYLIKSNEKEIGYFLIDFMPGNIKCSIYEIFILNEYRNLGFGNKAVQYIEDIAKGRDFKEIYVFPLPLDENTVIEKLLEFYKNLGFATWEGDERYLVKNISGKVE